MHRKLGCSDFSRTRSFHPFAETSWDSMLSVLDAFYFVSSRKNLFFFCVYNENGGLRWERNLEEVKLILIAGKGTQENVH